MNEDLENVLNYYLEEVASGNERPCSVIMSLARLKWPDRKFHFNGRVSETDDELAVLDDLHTKGCRVTAADLFEEWAREQEAYVESRWQSWMQSDKGQEAMRLGNTPDLLERTLYASFAAGAGRTSPVLTRKGDD